ncbi:uncharacterized protein LOC133645909 [Entelurus aequoreus]|uniref:uncharacterized protein LOC133645909 n=1 Tax=Entelurus aequoreus TaxID=161455 RepID=UPI002B1E09E8|nr:uncharacterized protein LOC133645909 [Entelurus aequoreus]
MVSEVQQRWPALFSCEEISEEFHRITSKDLLKTFNESLENDVPRLLRLYRARKGAFGQQIEDFLDKLDEQTSDIVSHRKMTALRCLPVFVRDDTTKFFLQHLKTGLKKECSEACLLASLQSLKKMILLYHPTYGTGLLCWKVPSCYMTCQTSNYAYRIISETTVVRGKANRVPGELKRMFPSLLQDAVPIRVPQTLHNHRPGTGRLAQGTDAMGPHELRRICSQGREPLGDVGGQFREICIQGQLMLLFNLL